MLPMFELDLLHTSVGGFAKYINKFIEKKGYTNYHLLGNSLGGHIALVHILKHPEKVRSLILTAVPVCMKAAWAILIPVAAIMNT
jgi:pimeloyl-ACP methyl ester carboxylesterase